MPVTKPGRSAVVILADRSRSARPVREALRAGLTSLLADQQGDVLAAVVPSGSSLPTLRPAADVSVPALRPRGTATLRDDLGVLVTDLGTALSAMPEEDRPSRVLVLVVGTATGGTRWSQDAIADLVGAQQRDYAWEFAFVGSGDAAAELGIHRVLPATLCDEGVRAGLAAASGFLGRARDAQPWAPVEGFSDADRVAAGIEAPAATPTWWQRLVGRKPELAAADRR
ncbi:MAG: hypothetical protein BGP03_21520 [Pseudonocardia sp. 73-21]|nr:MAG: hypothetical protein BGP03_21520 [Pseudonocardia sp. 73-21]